MAKTKTEQVRYLTKTTLRLLLKDQDGWDYNRQVRDDWALGVIEDQPDDSRYPLNAVMLHSHRAGEECEDHYRCLLTLDVDEHVYVDVPIPYYHGLPPAQ